MNYLTVNSDFGSAIALLSHSGLHKNISLHYIYLSVMPPVLLGQYLLMQNKNNEAIGYVSWAKLNSETEKKYLEDPASLTLSDWNSGEDIWITDFVCLSGKKEVKTLFSTLAKTIFPNKIVKSIRSKPGHGKRILKRYKGIDVLRTDQGRILA